MRNSIAVGIVVIALGGCMDESPPIVLHPVDGIRGELVEGTVQIAYESAQHDGVLTSEINAADGRTLWRYQETPDELGRVHVAVTVNDEGFYGVYDGDIAREMQALAVSEEGTLIKRLALQLVTDLPQDDLVAERRGLESAYQAIQQFDPQVDESHATSADYFMSPTTGYVVRSQQDVAFAHNHVGSSVVPLEGDDGLAPGGVADHNADRVNECYGNCGASCSDSFGCGNQRGWVDSIVPGSEGWSMAAETYCHDIYWQWVVRYYWVPIKTVDHTYYGKTNWGCRQHDECCRATGWGWLDTLNCWTTCMALVPTTAVMCINTWDISFSYEERVQGGGPIVYTGEEYLQGGSCMPGGLTDE